MIDNNIRVRFAPSPTGPLHIGGVRTALYNYLFAKKHGGTFILRIEDTDQGRYVPGAESYIAESLDWCGLSPDEGPAKGGAFGPYRQSERRSRYADFAMQLVNAGHAYYAFDSAEELNARREAEAGKGNHNFRYDNSTRLSMKNSLTLPPDESAKLVEAGRNVTVRLKVPLDETVTFQDLIRGTVSFQTNELDDKVLLKADGMPTYHLANIVDDHLMKISHVIRGEEWLSSTGHHVLLYRAFGWEDSMPVFAHLPLILKPNGKGKLSKRDGSKFNMPVFPLAWKAESEEDSFSGFREFGFLPEAVVNFLAFLGWNPGTEQEIFSLSALSEAFSIDNISKSGARFDYDKAKWYNQQYIQDADAAALAKMLRPLADARGYQVSDEFLTKFCELMKERVSLLPEFMTEGHYFFEPVSQYDDQNIAKRWNADAKDNFSALVEIVEKASPFEADTLEKDIKGYIVENGLKMGQLFPLLRIALAGTMKGPDVFKMMALLGKQETLDRLNRAMIYFDGVESR